MTELKISDSTQLILDKYKVDIQSAESVLNIAKKAANDILNVILFEAHINPNEIENLQASDEKITFDLIKKPVISEKEYEELGITKKEIDEAMDKINN